MGKLYWGRYKKQSKTDNKDFFKGKSRLLQQIERGDYDVSKYANMANERLKACMLHQEHVKQTWKGGSDSLAHELKLIEQRCYRQYNKLMESFHEDEERVLAKLRVSLYKEFTVDCWEEAILADPDQNLIQFYHTYRLLAQQKKKS